MDLTNSQIKFISSLSQKKYRDRKGCFVAEGTKCVQDTWGYFNCRMLVATREWAEQYGNKEYLANLFFANKQQMQRMSQFSTASEVIAVYDIPEYAIDDAEILNSLNIVLDNVQDPGNLGTIIRLADWFGIKNIFCSRTTVDVFNHKVVQATMGAISRVHVHYCDIDDLLSKYNENPIYGTFLDGDNIYESNISNKGFIIFGNEGMGISDSVAKLVTHRLLIPSYPNNAVTSESLNVGMAVAITVSEFRRRAINK